MINTPDQKRNNRTPHGHFQSAINLPNCKMRQMLPEVFLMVIALPFHCACECHHYHYHNHKDTGHLAATCQYAWWQHPHIHESKFPCQSQLAFKCPFKRALALTLALALALALARSVACAVVSCRVPCACVVKGPS
jgi:hypothetical protein